MVEKVSWKGWTNVYRIWNETVQILVLADVGPRIIWYGFRDGENILHEVASHTGLSGGGEFRLYGGHRLWVSPEVERTYFPDNGLVSVRQHHHRILFTAPVENRAPGTNLQKELEVELAETGTCVHLLHRVINHDRQTTELAPWAPTMMKGGGRAILPLPPRVAMDRDHYLPVGPLTLWSYTDLSDRRWRWGTEYIQLLHSGKPSGRFEEQMTGIFNPSGWGAYFVDDMLFVKRAPVIEKAIYPDFGCNFELFTNHDFLELETLGAMAVLRTGEQATHSETWQLFPSVDAGEDEKWIRSTILPLLNQQC